MPTVSGTTGTPTNTQDGQDEIYEWSGAGSITFSQGGLVEYLVVAGGGGAGGSGGFWGSGGGGAGGLLTGSFTATASTYNITVGSGGAGGTARTVAGTSGGNSSIVGTNAPAAAIGGGAGGAESDAGSTGGSGGGASGNPVTGYAGTAGQGNAGGDASGGNQAGGGGGASATGSDGGGSGGNGGDGLASSITGSSVTYAGGGGGAIDSTGGLGGGGDGAPTDTTKTSAQDGTDGLGGGGGGVRAHSGSLTGGDGGNGTVIIRFTPDGATFPTLVKVPKQFHPDFANPKVKPTGLVEIDWSNTLTKGLVGLWLLNDKGNHSLNLVNDQIATHVSDAGNSPTRVVSHGEQALEFYDATGERVDVPDNPIYDCQDAISIFALATVDSVADVRTIISKGQGGQAGHAWDIKYHTSPNAVRVSLRSTSGQTNIDGATAPAVGKRHSWGMGWSDIDDNAYVYFDGKQDGSGTFAGQIQTNAQDVTIGNVDAWLGAGEFSGTISYVALWDTRITGADHKALSDNPYQLLKPIQGLYVEQASGSSPQNIAIGLQTDSETQLSFTIDSPVTIATGLQADSESQLSFTVDAGAVSQTIGLQTDSETQLSFTPDTSTLVNIGILTDSESQLGFTAETPFSQEISLLSDSETQISLSPQTEFTQAIGLQTDSETLLSFTPDESIIVNIGILDDSESQLSLAVTGSIDLQFGLITDSETVLGFTPPTYDVLKYVGARAEFVLEEIEAIIL